MAESHASRYRSRVITAVVVAVVLAVGFGYRFVGTDASPRVEHGEKSCVTANRPPSRESGELSPRQRAAARAAAKNAERIVDPCREPTNANPHWIAAGPRAYRVDDIDPLRSTAFLKRAGNGGILWWLGSASKHYACPSSPKYHDCTKPDWDLDSPSTCDRPDVDESRCATEEAALVWRTNVGLLARTLARLSEADAEFRLPRSWFDGLDERGRHSSAFDYHRSVDVPEEFRDRFDYGWVVFAPLLRYADFPDEVLVRLSVEILRADAEIDWDVGQPDVRNPYDPESPDALDPVAPVLDALGRNDTAAKQVATKTGDERVAKLSAD